MAELNHTIVPARDARTSATFLAELLDLEPPRRFGPFWTVQLENGVTLDYQHSEDQIPTQH
jgi:hypothetical protein